MTMVVFPEVQRFSSKDMDVVPKPSSMQLKSIAEPTSAIVSTWAAP